MILIFDTETTGLPRDWNAPLTDGDNWPRMVQLAWQLHAPDGRLISRGNRIVQPEGFTIPYNAVQIHGITTERAIQEGSPLSAVLEAFSADLQRAEYIMGHNVGFDVNIVGAECIRLGLPPESITKKLLIDSKEEATTFCAIPGGKGGGFKWPNLTELHEKLFGEPFAEAHDAAYDVAATARCFFGLVARGVVARPGWPAPDGVRYEAPVLEAANFAQAAPPPETTPKTIPAADATTGPGLEALADVPFSHLHVHSQFSVLQAVGSVDEIVATAKSHGMPAVALTDHGNMMGAFQFVRAARKAGILPILGAELNVCRDHKDRASKDDGYPVVLLAMNKSGYHQLARLSSKGYTDGFYYVPRIDRNLLEAHHEGLLVTTGGLFSEVPSLILNVGERQAEEAFLWWKSVFGDRFYAELNRHGLPEEEVVNETLLRFCERHGVPYFAANNTYYSRREQAVAHDILLCVKDAQNLSKPKKYVGKRGREFRFGLPNDNFYLRSPEEMKRLFADLPEAIREVPRLVARCESYQLERDVLLPAFDIPQEFVDPRDAEDGGKRGENAYLRHLTYVGAAKRYGEITEPIRERLDFELMTIEKTGYPGYFLIVQDFTREAREMGVSVGPGRGSAAGSAVAYCVGITNVDPIRYDLLFERFLNPDRVSLPDIDIDFDDEGRGKVIDYVIRKYGASQVAQIITYGTMAAKSSVRDTARVLELPLSDADRIAKLVPDISLKKLLGDDERALKQALRPDAYQQAETLRDLARKPGLEGQTLQTAQILEGSVRNTGIHPCGIIITPCDITELVPIATAKDSEMFCTQFDNSVAEDAGLLKMDFLGLKTLTIIKDAVQNVRDRHGIALDPDAFPLDDAATYALFQRGETVSIFQYESAGMQKYLKELKPTTFADLIAMNALYRPGPLEYIPSFIRRKHGQEPITFDLPDCEEFLSETYGITVYQEQVMLLSQKLAGFTKGEADTLRKAMGKKKADLIDKMRPQFLDQGEAKGHDRTKLEKIWKDWEAFASYAFNKSHSTCYAWVAYQTAYLKANYPAEYMAAVLSNSMSDIKLVTVGMDEARRMGVSVLGPCVNESGFKFKVNKEGAIRFGLGAMRGVGEGAVQSIIDGRKGESNAYQNIFEFSKRVSPRDVNKRVYEALALGGAFDGFAGVHRAQYFATDEKGRTVIERAAQYGASIQEGAASAQMSIFGDVLDQEVPVPNIPDAAPWEIMDQLNKEREIVGIYLSGHPLDRFRFEIEQLCTPRQGLLALQDLPAIRGKECRFAGRVVTADHRISKNGKPFGRFTLEDYHQTAEFSLFGKEYLACKAFMVPGWFVFIRGTAETRGFSGEEGTLEFKVKTMELLADIREKMVDRLRIQVALGQILPNQATQLSTLLREAPGPVGVSLDFTADGMGMEMISRTCRVDLSETLVDGLRKLESEGVLSMRLDMKRA